MQALGRHLIVEFYECDREVLDDIAFIESVMLEATNAMRATRVAHNFHKFAPQGVSGAVIIQESHLTIHTWPEYGYAAVDLYTCGNSCIPEAGLDLLKRKLQSKKMNVLDILRGLLAPSHKMLINADKGNIEFAKPFTMSAIEPIAQ